MATSEVRGPSKLEGTVHVNVQLIRKFMKNYFFNPQTYEEITPDFYDKDDLFIFNQGTAGGLGKVSFHDYLTIFEQFAGLANVNIFMQQIERFKQLLEQAGPDKAQDREISSNQAFA